MADSVVLTKSDGGDYQIVVTGDGYYFNFTKQFPRADYSVNDLGVKLFPYVGEPIMWKYYAPEAWTIDGVDGFTTNKQVTDAITALANS